MCLTSCNTFQKHPTISLRIPSLLGLFHTFEGGVSLASEIFLRALPSKNLKIHPKIGACGGLLVNSSYRYKVQVAESKRINIKLMMLKRNPPGRSLVRYRIFDSKKKNSQFCAVLFFSSKRSFVRKLFLDVRSKIKSMARLLT